MAYLERNPAIPLVYIIGALKNKRIPEIGNFLRNNGFDAMDEWYTPGEHADTNWQLYEKIRGRSYAEALKGRGATNIRLFDQSYIDLADAVVCVAPAGKSAMVELGYAKGQNKPVFFYLDDLIMERYDIMPGMIDAVVHSEEELLTALKPVVALVAATQNEN